MHRWGDDEVHEDSDDDESEQSDGLLQEDSMRVIAQDLEDDTN